MTVRLIPEPVLAARAAALGADPAVFDSYSADALADPLHGPALRYYVLLTERPQLLADLGLSDGELFSNRYYWFLRLKRLHEIAEHGGRECDSMAQEAFDMTDALESVDDYVNLSAVQKLARRDAAAQLSAAKRRKKRRKKK